MKRILRRKSWSWSSRRHALKGKNEINQESIDRENVEILSSSSTTTPLSSTSTPTTSNPPTFTLHSNNAICNVDISPSSSTSSEVSLMESVKINDNSNFLHPLNTMDYNHSCLSLIPDDTEENIKIPTIYESLIKNSIINPLYTGIPVNRLALFDKSDHLAFKFQLNNELKYIEQNYYFRWLVWYDKDNTKKKNILRCIETLRDLNEFLHHDYNQLIYKYQCHRFFITRYGIIPNRNQVPNGYTLELKLTKSSNEESPISNNDYNENGTILTESSIKSFICLLCKAIFSNQIYNSLDDLQISVCGISYKSLLNSIQVSIWIYPFENHIYNEEFLIDQIQILIKILRFNVSSNNFESLFDKVLLMNNNNNSTIILEFI
ncbi:hypothetical protein DFJ63DRAFT_338260 [Scheffersomyces coipomensis]|uniref:uncharacterized protein n=1 Tax=Scheffersomyces coipomensis TaxID=1788519 RepID=UPI00315D73B3